MFMFFYLRSDKKVKKYKAAKYNKKKGNAFKSYYILFLKFV